MFTKCIETLRQRGIFEFLSEIARTEEVVALSAPQLLEVIRTAIGSTYIDIATDLSTISQTAIVLDCRPLSARAQDDSFGSHVTTHVSLLIDAVACYLAGNTSLVARRNNRARYYILASPRSGSTFVCDLLGCTQQLGTPTEHLKPWLKEYLLELEAPLSEFLASLHRYGSSANGIFGSKLIIDDLFAFIPEFEEEMFEELAHGSTFLLIRGDKAEQALSNVRSNRVGVYHVYGDGPRGSQIDELSRYKAELEEVFAKERWLLRQEADLLDLLTSRGIFPKLLSYEALTQSRQGAAAGVREVGKTVDVQVTAVSGWPSLIKISTELPESDIQRYRSFRTRTRLYSTRSEPWLGNVLGIGWEEPEKWGVRSMGGTVQIKLPGGRNLQVIQLLINIGADSPTSLCIGATTVAFQRPASVTYKAVLDIRSTRNHLERAHSE
jgi:LPS sulfotransferase NodH